MKESDPISQARALLEQARSLERRALNIVEGRRDKAKGFLEKATRG